MVGSKQEIAGSMLSLTLPVMDLQWVDHAPVVACCGMIFDGFKAGSAKELAGVDVPCKPFPLPLPKGPNGR